MTASVLTWLAWTVAAGIWIGALAVLLEAVYGDD